MAKLSNTINIENRRAKFDYQFLDTLVAGLVLKGTEIKSIREGKAGLSDSYCYFRNDELFVKNLHISEYADASFYQHEALRERKLLLSRQELNKLLKKVKDQGLTVIPTRLFINDKGFAKMEIALAKGKKLFDKRDDIKKKDIEREMNRKF
ncbi:MAG: SsrA-binding protein SmpB [Bacteroidota bacterium]|nr:SsrA-binding protein SmpB [Bacteroidota bacterium]MDP3146245.1 SsrA-binding protein SmpB [Bacteroidota bacterium]MDP3558128.1 SsrA-binding protein SmpB [Bacteroidota bacterium]